MNDLRILIVEDNPSIALEEEMLIEEMGFDLAGIADNGEDALLKIQESKPDLILMDIQLKGKLSGLDIARQIRHLHIPIIFTTSFNDRARYEEARKMFSFGYLVKPFDKLSLESAIEVAFRAQELQPPAVQNRKEGKVYRQYFMVKHNGVLQKVEVDQVLYIGVEGNYSSIYTTEKRFVVKISLRKLSEELDPHRFMWIHKSHIVQIARIQSIDTGMNLIKIGGNTIPVGRHFKAELLERFRMLK